MATDRSAGDMSTDRPTDDEIAQQLRHVGRYVQVINAGLIVILTAFVLAVVGLVPARMGSLPELIDAILLPLIFVGLGLLLFGIGRHLHLLHLNLVRQLGMNTDDSDESGQRESE
ncbi:MAG: hypothetical protein U9O06_12700 [Euryarchaeota archaeon]|nr:hypothetical protein [Euryarchaeota archaeon]